MQQRRFLRHVFPGQLSTQAGKEAALLLRSHRNGWRHRHFGRPWHVGPHRTRVLGSLGSAPRRFRDGTGCAVRGGIVTGILIFVWVRVLVVHIRSRGIRAKRLDRVALGILVIVACHVRIGLFVVVCLLRVRLVIVGSRFRVRLIIVARQLGVRLVIVARHF